MATGSPGMGRRDTSRRTWRGPSGTSGETPRRAGPPPFPRETSGAHSVSARRQGPPRSPTTAGALAAGGDGGVGLLRARADRAERLGAAGAQHGPSPAPEDQPHRRPAELRPELRADLDLSEAQR